MCRPEQTCCEGGAYTERKARGAAVLAVLGFIGGFIVVLSGIVAAVSIPAALSEYGDGDIFLASAVPAFFIIRGVASAVVSVLTVLVANLVGAVIGALLLWYFLKPHVKEYFLGST